MEEPLRLMAVSWLKANLGDHCARRLDHGQRHLAQIGRSLGQAAVAGHRSNGQTAAQPQVFSPARACGDGTGSVQ